MEIVEEGDRFRLWQDSYRYYECFVDSGGIQPTNFLPLLAVETLPIPSNDDSSADETADEVDNIESTEESSGDSGDEVTSENDPIEGDSQVPVSDNLDESTGTDLNSSEETSSQSGGGGFWLPLLILALAYKRPMLTL